MQNRIPVEISADATRNAGQVAAMGGRTAGAQRGEIGFVGLGRIGSAMAATLASAGHPVRAFAIQPEQMKELQVPGMRPTMHMPDLFDCGIVVRMLPDDNAVRDVFQYQQRNRWTCQSSGCGRDPSFDEHDQHGGRRRIHRRASAPQARLCRRDGVRKPRCRQDAATCNHCQRRPVLLRTLPSARSSWANIRGRNGRLERQPDRAAGQ
jgi:hypothetical protein